MAPEPIFVEILDENDQWIEVVKEDDVDPGWLRFHWLDGRVGLAAPGRWREKKVS